MSEYQKRYKHLKSLGFGDEVIKIWRKQTPKLFTEEFVDAKIKGLEERGFENPVKMIVSLPAILGYAFENIDAKINYGRKLRRFGVNGIAIAEVFPPLLGYSIKRLRFFARIVLSLTDGDETMFISLMSQEPLAVAAGRLGPDSLTKKSLRKNIRLRRGRLSENMALLFQRKEEKVCKAYLRYKTA